MAATFLSASALALLAIQTSQAAYLPNQLLPRQSAAAEMTAPANTCPVPAPLQTVWEPSIPRKNAKGEDGSRQSFGPPNVGQGKNKFGQPLTPAQGKKSKVHLTTLAAIDYRRLTKACFSSTGPSRSATSSSPFRTVCTCC